MRKNLALINLKSSTSYREKEKYLILFWHKYLNQEKNDMNSITQKLVDEKLSQKNDLVFRTGKNACMVFSKEKCSIFSFQKYTILAQIITF